MKVEKEKGYLNELEHERVLKVKKKKRHILRIILLVLAFCIVVFGAVVFSDVFFGKQDTTSQEPEIIVVTVSGKSIELHEDKQVSFSELKSYFDALEEAGDLFAVALINDTENPADYVVYNSIVDLLAEYDIICEKMPKPASYDEVYASTEDEYGVS